MRILDAAKQPVVRWTAIIALLVSLTQFDKGLDLIYRKWNADVVAGEASKTATSVRSDFDRYIESEQQAQALESQRIEMQQDFNRQLLELQQQQAQPPRATPPTPPRPSRAETPHKIEWVEPDADGCWSCWALTPEACWLEDGSNLWERVELTRCK